MSEEGLNSSTEFKCHQDHDFATTVTSIEQKLHKPTSFDEEKEEEEGLGEFSVLADKLPPNSSYCIQVICPKCNMFLIHIERF